MKKQNIEAVYPLSPMQQGMVFHSLYAPESSVYFEQLSCILRGELRTDAFRRAWQETISRQAVLRTSFVWKRMDRMLQVVQKDVEVPLEISDWREFLSGEQVVKLHALQAADRARGFDLAKAPLIRLTLVRLEDEKYYFLWSHHHALMDGWSVPLLFKEVLTLYENYAGGEHLAQGKELVLSPARPYKDYINWLQEQDVNAAETYWRGVLGGIVGKEHLTAPTPLMVEASRERLAGTERFAIEDVQKHPAQYAEQEIKLDKNLSTDLQSLARRQRVTLSTILQGAWGLLLSRYSGDEDVIFGVTVSGRPADLAGAEMMIGLFINTLPVRIHIDTQVSISEWLAALQAQMAEARQYEHSSLVQIQEWSDIPRGTPMFESILVFENYPVEDTLKDQVSGSQGNGRVRIESIQSHEQTNFPLTIVSGPGETIGIKASYDTGRFDDDAILRMLGHLKQILEQFARRTDIGLAEVNLLTSEEEKTLLTDWVASSITSTDQFPAGWEMRTIHELFTEQAKRTPDAVALILADKEQQQDKQGSGLDLQPLGDPNLGSSAQMTYQELDQRSDQLAAYLAERGVGPEKLVGLMVERSFELVIGILGILKTGGAYLPLDPSYPDERLAFMLEDTQAPVLLTQSWLAVERQHVVYGNSSTNRQVVILDQDWANSEPGNRKINSVTKSQDSEDRSLHASPENLANVIYTSGSTGKPKGVMVEHRSLVNHALNYASLVGMGANDRALQFLALGFDAAGEEIFPTLVSGAALVLPGPVREMMAADLFRICNNHSVTILHLPVAVWHQAVDETLVNDLKVPEGIRAVVVGGESPSLEKLSTWIKKSNRETTRLFINAYGPTETTIAVTFYKLDVSADSDEPLQTISRLPIGKNIANVQLYIVDQQMRPVPIGVAGEIVVGGRGVARGYLNQPALTSEKFIPNPFLQQMTGRWAASTGKNALDNRDGRLYRTGDLGRYLPDGNIEFLGRVDQQVKLRGFRIELGEIEAVLNGHASVTTAVVMAREDIPGNRQLVAYAVLDDGIIDASASAGLLREYLQERLPEYMVPAAYVILESMPLTPNGKIDRRALPAPQGVTADLSNVYLAPRTPVEAIIAGIWEQVLGVQHVGVHDNFFDLGGHSLLATQVVSRLRSAFQIEIPLRDLFEASTMAELARRVEAALNKDAVMMAPPIELIERDPASGIPVVPPQLSFSQQRLWFLDQLAPGNLFYNIPLAVEMTGHLDASALEQTLNEIIRRHAVLRTNFQSSGGVPVQVIAPDLKLKLAVEDLSNLVRPEQEQVTLHMAQEEARTSFNLEKDPLIRARLIKLDHDQHVFLLTMHHIVSDGWSMGVFLNEVAHLYQAFSAGQVSPLPELKIQYFDFAEWQRAWLQGEQLDRQLDYWKKQLKDQPRILDLPTDYPRPAVQSWRGATLSFEIGGEITDRLNKFSRQEGVTLFMTLLAAYQTLLYRYSSQEDVSVGIAIANRNRAEIEPLIGFFVNTLVMRTDLSGEPNFKELVKRVREITLGAYAHQDLPFEMLVEALQPERDMSHTPLFQVAFALQNVTQVSTGAGELLRTLSDPTQSSLSFRVLEVDSASAKFDMTVTLSETVDGLQGAWEYNSDLFEETTIRRMIDHYTLLLSGAMDEPDHPVSRLPLLTEAESHAILVEWNSSAMPTPVDRCAHQLFEAQVMLRPDATALIFEDQKYSYQEVNWRAELIANHLVAGREHLHMGVGPGRLVGVMMERSPEMIVAILGVMKAGAAYLPLDPAYPQDRLRYMLEDSGVSVLLTQNRLLEPIDRLLASVKSSPEKNNSPVKHTLPAIIAVDFAGKDIPSSDVWDQFRRAPDRTSASGEQPDPDSLAYVIYTSGSTGRPKGTMLRHKGLSNLAEWQRETFGIQEGSRILQFSPLSFDASVWEIFMALTNGGTLVLGRQEVLASGDDLLDLLKSQEVTTATLPPSVLRILPADKVSRQALPKLETVISAGEACTPDLVQIWAPERNFFNAYGPTETTVCASIYRCSENETTAPPIGRPIANMRLYVLDGQQQPTPVGVPGELYVSGVGLAVGYLNQPEMTEQKFIPNPLLVKNTSLADHSEQSYSRLYRTGDLARYQIDGNIEYLGRVDQQVKVRGFRIELGEIEAALGSNPKVKEAVVVVSGGSGENADLRLVAFVVPSVDNGQGLPDVNELKATLRQTLPEYMLPSAFVIQDELPLSPSGKVDRKALAALQAFERPDIKVEYVAPRNETEETLVHISQELLRLEKVGVHDNFFELGGHSLLATQFISRVRDEFDIELPLRKLFELPTVASIAVFVEVERVSNTAKANERARIEEMLQKISQLSADDVSALLDQRKSAK